MHVVVTDRASALIVFDLLKWCRMDFDKYVKEIHGACKAPGESERCRVEDAVNELYASLGLSAPRITWCDGPMQFIILPLMFYWCRHVANANTADQRKRYLTEIFRPYLKTSLLTGLRQGPSAVFLNNLLQKMTDLNPDVNNCVGPLLNSRLVQKLNRTLTPSLADQLEMSKDPKTKLALEHAVQRAFSGLNSSLRTISELTVQQHSISHALYVLKGDRAHDGTACAEECISPGTVFRYAFGAWDLYFVATFDYAARCGWVDFTHECAQELALWMSLLNGAMAYLFLENECFILSYPKSLILDERSRCHSLTGPAIEFLDGYKIFCWNGIAVPGQIILEREKLTPALIDRQSNIELRRIMIELYGWEKYLKKSKAWLVHEDEFGRLYRKEMENDEPILAVEVVNSTAEPDGTFKRYMLRVPPNMTRAKQAVAWTFGVREDDYNPLLET